MDGSCGQTIGLNRHKITANLAELSGVWAFKKLQLSPYSAVVSPTIAKSTVCVCAF
jgi:hypothetical protein